MKIETVLGKDRKFDANKKNDCKIARRCRRFIRFFCVIKFKKQIAFFVKERRGGQMSIKTASMAVGDTLQQLELAARKALNGTPMSSDSFLQLFSLMNTHCHLPDGQSDEKAIEKICNHFNALYIFREMLLSLVFTRAARQTWCMSFPTATTGRHHHHQGTRERPSSADTVYVDAHTSEEKARATIALLLLLYQMSNAAVVRKELFRHGFMVPFFSISLAPQCLCFSPNVNQLQNCAERHKMVCVKNCSQVSPWLQRWTKIRNLSVNILCNMCHCEPLKELIGGTSGAIHLKALVAIAEQSVKRKEYAIATSAVAAVRNLTTSRCNCRILAALSLFSHLLNLLRTVFALHQEEAKHAALCEHLLVIFINASRSVRAVDSFTLQTEGLFKTLSEVCHHLHQNANLYQQFEKNCDLAVERYAAHKFESSDEGPLQAEDLLDEFGPADVDSEKSAADATDSSLAPNAAAHVAKQQRQKPALNRRAPRAHDRLLESAQVFMQDHGPPTVDNSDLQKALHIDCPLAVYPHHKLKLGKEIGKGTYSHVYAATYNGCEIAAKVLVSTLPSDAVAREKLLLEFKLMAMLRHPNIVQLMGVSCTPKMQIIVCTEFCHRGCLKDNLEKVTDMIVRLQFAQDIINGLNWMHTNNIVHRDLKPANLLVRQDYSVVVADFGLSLYVGTDGSKKPISRHFKGNVKYSAPEILQLRALNSARRGRQTYQYTYESDVYSFALILWEILAPQDRLFGQIMRGRAGITEFVVSGGRPRLFNDWPKSICQLLSDCWNASPKQRPRFDLISRRFEPAVVDFLCPDVLGRAIARKLWQGNYKQPVRYARWEAEFEQASGVSLSQMANGGDIRHCLQSMLCIRFDQRPMVTFERFCSMLHYMGPMTSPVGFLNDMLSLFRRGWFFGFLRKNEAQSFLARALQENRDATGYFLIRFSVSHRGSYIIDMIRNDGHLFERKIAHKCGSRYTVALSDDARPTDYDDIASLLKDCLECETCLQGFKPLRNSPVSMYLNLPAFRSSYTLQRHSGSTSTSSNFSSSTVPRRRHTDKAPQALRNAAAAAGAAAAERASQTMPPPPARVVQTQIVKPPTTAVRTPTMTPTRRPQPHLGPLAAVAVAKPATRKLAGKPVSLVSMARTASSRANSSSSRFRSAATNNGSRRHRESSGRARNPKNNNHMSNLMNYL